MNLRSLTLCNTKSPHMHLMTGGRHKFPSPGLTATPSPSEGERDGVRGFSCFQRFLSGVNAIFFQVV